MTRTKVLALIMAGGSGGRLGLLTEHRAKPVMPYAGVYRLIDFPLSNCMHSGIPDVWVVEQYLPHSLNDHLSNGRPWDLDRTYGGLRLLQPFQGGEEGGWHRGNADALYRNASLIRGFNPDVVVVLSADHVYTLDYRDVIDDHLERRAEVTMVTTKVEIGEAGRYGTVRVDAEGRIAEFEYKPPSPRSDIVTAEVFVYDARALLRTLDELTASGDEEQSLGDYGEALVPSLVDRGRAYEHRLDGYWRDVGTVDSYWTAHMDLLAPEPPYVLDDPRWPIVTFGVQRRPARVHPSARIEDALISPGCSVRGRVERSVLAPGVRVEEGAVVRDAIVLHDCVIEAGATVDCAVLDEGARIGAGAQLGEPRAKGTEAPSAAEIVLVGRRASVVGGIRIAAGDRVAPVPGAETSVR